MVFSCHVFMQFAITLGKGIVPGFGTERDCVFFMFLNPYNLDEDGLLNVIFVGRDGK